MTHDIVYYMLPIAYEDTKRGGIGWYKLSWRPIWRGTFSFFISHHHLFGIYCYRCDADNGWGRFYKHLYIEFGLAAITIAFWIKWDFLCHKDGPMDSSIRRPLAVEEITIKKDNLKRLVK